MSKLGNNNKDVHEWWFDFCFCYWYKAFVFIKMYQFDQGC